MKVDVQGFLGLATGTPASVMQDLGAANGQPTAPLKAPPEKAPNGHQ